MDPPSNTLLEWISLAKNETDLSVHDTGLHLEHNARAILEAINPIKPEILGKLEGGPGISAFVSDGYLAEMANTAIPHLPDDHRIRAIDIFNKHTQL